MKQTLINIKNLLFGRTYYLCVVHRVGTDIYEVNSTLMKSKAEVKEYKKVLMSTKTFEYVETLTVHTHTDYNHVREM